MTRICASGTRAARRRLHRDRRAHGTMQSRDIQAAPRCSLDASHGRRHRIGTRRVSGDTHLTGEAHCEAAAGT
jgi:hypothetical protein